MRCAPLLCLLLSACSSGIWTDTPVPLPTASPVVPPSQEEVLKGVQNVVVQAKLKKPFEISTLRKTYHGPGEYFICLREANPSPEERRPPYSVFFDDVYKGSRQSVIIEACETQQYTPLN